MAPHRQKRIIRTTVAFAAAIPLGVILLWLGIDLLWSLLPAAVALTIHTVQMFNTP